MPVEPLDDGTLDFSLGQNSWANPTNIRENQYSRGVNVTNRGGVLKPRNGYHQLDLVFDSSEIIIDIYKTARPIRELWEGGKFQAAIPQLFGTDKYIVTVISGYIFRTSVATKHTTLLSTTIKVNQYSPRINWCFAADKIILFDFPGNPVVIDGSTVFRSSLTDTVNGIAPPQIPASVVGAYNQNRLFVANSGVEFTASDGVGNVATPNAPLTFNEVFTPSSPFVNQFFSLTDADGLESITAMGFLQALDQSMGIGALFVATKDKIHYYNTQQPRADWTQSQFGGVMVSNGGIVGSRAFVNVNSDIIFVSPGPAVRSFSTARNDARKWGNAPMSREIAEYFDTPNTDLLDYTVVGYFDNRIFISAKPYRIRATTVNRAQVMDYVFGGFIVLELDNVSSLLAESPPIWTGLWTGVNPLDMVVLGDQCFIIGKEDNNTYGANRLYELQKGSRFDVVGGRKRLVRSYIYTKEYDFKNPYVQKREHTVILSIADIAGEFYVRVDRKPGHGHNFKKYGSLKYNAATSTKFVPADAFINGLAKHNLKALIFGDAEEDGVNPITNDTYDTFESIQLRIELQGEDWTLDSIKLRALLVSVLERQYAVSFTEETSVFIPLTRDPDWDIPDTICQ